MADPCTRMDETNPIFRLSLSEFRSELNRRGYGLKDTERLRKMRRKLKNRRYKQEARLLQYPSRHHTNNPQHRNARASGSRWTETQFDGCSGSAER